MKRLPEVKELRRLFNYDEETGVLTRAVKVNKRSLVGDVAGSLTHNGYLKTGIDKAYYSVHRIIYKMATGIDPGNLEIDHINGDRVDNRMQNLRAVDCSTNMRNCRMLTANTSGRTGVRFEPARNKWRAYIHLNNKGFSLGRFTLKEDAIKAREAAEKANGFHVNHGRQS